jgi:signal transduction histidine kinase
MASVEPHLLPGRRSRLAHGRHSGFSLPPSRASRGAGQLTWAERVGERRERSRLKAERLRIARELHDVVAHGFATISLQAGVAAHAVDQRPEQVAEALEAIKGASREALEELRGILGMLRHDEGRRDPAPGLDQLDELVLKTSAAGTTTQLKISGSPRTLPTAVDRAAYRIVQEALTNVLRHAGGAAACVSISYEKTALLVSVDDDGPGAADVSEHAHVGSGYGITGMRERARALGGDVEAGPCPDGGFRVAAHLPLGPRR